METALSSSRSPFSHTSIVHRRRRPPHHIWICPLLFNCSPGICKSHCPLRLPYLEHVSNLGIVDSICGAGGTPTTLHIQTILNEKKSSLPHPKILRPGHRVKEEHGPSGLGDCLICVLLRTSPLAALITIHVTFWRR